MYKILIVDDYLLFCEVIYNVIVDGFFGSEVMEIVDFDSVLGLIQEYDDFDLILFDLNMFGMYGFNGLMNLCNEVLIIFVVIVFVEQDKQVVLQVIIYGVVGFIIKFLLCVQMIEVIEQIFNGNVYLFLDVICIQKSLL